MRVVTTEYILLMILIPFLKTTKGSVEIIKIGAIFHQGEDHLENAFDQALKDLENEENNYFILKPIKRRNVPSDSFKVYKIACELLEEGIAIIFGPSQYQSRNVVSNIAGHFHVPHIIYSFRTREEEMVRSKSISVYPSTRIFEKVVAKTVKHMSWHAYTFVYQTDDALGRIQEALQNQGRSDVSITIRQLLPLSKINQLPTEKDRDNVYESLIKELQLTSQFTLLLDIENENLEKLFETMSKMKLMNDYFMCLIMNLDSTSVDVKSFISKGTVANITQFQFIPNNDNGFSVEAALLYDSVFAFSETLTNLYKASESMESFLPPKPLSCEGDAKYDAGRNITEMFLKKTKMGPMTRMMTFNKRGQREFVLDVINIQGGRPIKVGEWTGHELLLNQNEKKINDTLTESAKNKIFKVTTREGPPYVMQVDDESKGRLIGNKKYEGYCIDLIAKIEEILQIRCEFEIVKDGMYGSYNPLTRQWNGLIKELLDFKADFAICDLTITSERQSAVDFTAPFMNLGISILFSKPEKVVPKLFAFMSPLSTEVWMYMATAYLVVSLMLFFQARIAPGEWVNPHPCNPDPEELENNLTLMNSMWLTMGSLMQQGSDILPRTPSIRMVAGMWWFFVLIMVSSYTANLAAFLTAVKMEDSINDVEDLAKQTKISYGALKDGSTHSFFRNSNTTLYQRIFNTMTDAKPTVFTKTNAEGVDRVIKGKRKYAFFMESTSIEYQIERHCELQMVGSLLDNKGYGIAMPPNSPYRTLISTAILNLQERGELQQLKQKWWKEKGGGKCTEEESDEPTNSNELGMPHVGGVFLVLMLGCVISTFIAIVEFLWNVRKISVEQKITPWEALVDEVKFVINVSAVTKPVKTAKSSSKSTSFQANDKGDSLRDSMQSSLQGIDMKEIANVNRINEMEDASENK